jgi:hypothetical protein
MLRAPDSRLVPFGDRPGNQLRMLRHGFAGERAFHPPGLEDSTEGANSHDRSGPKHCKTVLPTEERCAIACIHRRGNAWFMRNLSGTSTAGAASLLNSLVESCVFVNAVSGESMTTIGKCDHARRAGGICPSPGLIRPEVMKTLAGSRSVLLRADGHSAHWQAAAVRVCAPAD